MRRNFLFYWMPTRTLSLVNLGFSGLLLWISCLSSLGHAQTPPITPSGLNTQVSGPLAVGGKTQFDITGGTRAGTNLFHSFGDFNVPNNNIANFLNTSVNGVPPSTSNILGRVTGGNISNIFGTIQTTGFGNANLFLMNPTGFLFGPNATVNVGGMVAFTSADYLRLADGVLFNAIPNATADALLSAAPVAAFGFLGSNPGAITVQGSQLSVTPGQSISLVGGNITIQSGTLDNGTVQPALLSAPGGQINLASVASPGEILTGTLAQAPNVNGQSFGALGAIQISQQSVIDVSGDGGGTALIRGGQFLLDNSTISANVTGPGPVTNGAESIGSGIDIQVTQKAVIQPGSLLETNVLGNATPGVTYGGTHIKADRIEIIGDPGFDFDNGPFTEIHSDVASGSTGGNSGPIKLEGDSILLQDFVTLRSYTEGTGNGGDIILRTSGKLELNGSSLDAESISSPGNAGSIELTSAQGNILMTNGPFITSQVIASTGNVGNITVSAPGGDVLLAGVPGELFIPGSLFTAIRGTGGTGGSGGIQITAKNLTLANAGIAGDNLTPLRPGNIMVNLSGTLNLLGPSPNTFIHTIARTAGAPAADLSITAHDIFLTNNSSISTETRSSGPGGVLNIFTQNLQLTNGGQLISGSFFPPSRPGSPPLTPSGAGGTITVQGLAGPAGSVLIDGAGSGIFTNTEGTGAGGNINILANTMTLQNGGTLSAATSGTTTSAIGGSISVNATGVTMTNGGSITASSTGPGNAGNISIDAGQQLVMQNSSIKTEAAQAGGGNINLQAVELLRAGNSQISTSVLGGSGSGGNITIDPNSVVLQNSQILANAVQGTGGNISITTNLLLQDANSTISASSQFGLNGTVTIQSPISQAGGKIQQLGKSPLQATSLLSQRCAALAGGEFSSFTVAGRDSLPAEPGSWLSSPLAQARLAELTTSSVKEVSGEPAFGEVQGERVFLSLRQIAPPGFLTQSFAVDESAGCTS